MNYNGVEYYVTDKFKYMNVDEKTDCKNNNTDETLDLGGEIYYYLYTNVL